MENRPSFAAIGLTFSNETLHVLIGVLENSKFAFGGEGTMASGYELYVAHETVAEAIEVIRTSPLLVGHDIEIYSRVRDSNDGTRYDRLIDHFEGENPERPSFNGISFHSGPHE